MAGVLAAMTPTNSVPPVYGLVLTGGKSSRMRRDKAALTYHGRTQLDWAMSFLQPYVERAFVSVRADQADDPVRAKYARIVDTLEHKGPIAGIAAAQAQYPGVAWLVLACDLPFLDENTLETLLAARDPKRTATAFRSSHDGLPEPLCTIWEPRSRDAILAYIESGKDCPRKFLIRSTDTLLLDEPNPNALDNVNTPEEYGSAMTTLSPTKGPAAGDSPAGTASDSAASAATAKKLKVQYYALLREQAGRSEESVTTSARTPRELYTELKARYPFSLAPEMLRVAVNAEFGDWQQPLSDGDSVVFIPPVAGG
ncbi:MAG TPA: NTP transferase domain-containing protein [Steroidobacteraceae bacterium]|jgi:molybdopterin-guanine dinucleotide biosynthesis protein A